MTDDPRVKRIFDLMKEICSKKSCEHNKKKPLSCGKEKIARCGITQEAAEVFARTYRVMILRRRNE